MSHSQFSENKFLSQHQPFCYGSLWKSPILPPPAKNSNKCKTELLLVPLTGFKRWSVQNLYPPLFGVFIRMTFIYFRNFPYHHVIPHIFRQHTLHSFPPTNPHPLPDSFCPGIVTAIHLSIHKIQSISLPQQIHTSLSSLLFNPSKSAICSLVIIYLTVNAHE